MVSSQRDLVIVRYDIFKYNFENIAVFIPNGLSLPKFSESKLRL